MRKAILTTVKFFGALGAAVTDWTPYLPACFNGRHYGPIASCDWAGSAAQSGLWQQSRFDSKIARPNWTVPVFSQSVTMTSA
jgi:hypothetical protein